MVRARRWPAARWPSTSSTTPAGALGPPGGPGARAPQRPQRRGGRGGGAGRRGAASTAAARALARFAGVARRFEFRGEARGVTFVDDYAHLPSEVRGRPGRRQGGGWRRVVAVFQPHRYSRTAGPGRGVRDRLRRRRRGGGHRRLRRRRGPDPRGVRPAGGRRRPAGPARHGRSTTCPAGPSCVPVVGALLEPGRPVLHPGGRRPHLAARRAAGRPGMVRRAVTPASDHLRRSAEALGRPGPPGPPPRGAHHLPGGGHGRPLRRARPTRTTWLAVAAALGRHGRCRCWCWAGAPTCWWPTRGFDGPGGRARSAGFDARSVIERAPTVARRGGGQPAGAGPPDGGRRPPRSGVGGGRARLGGRGGADERRRPRLRHRRHPGGATAWSTWPRGAVAEVPAGRAGRRLPAPPRCAATEVVVVGHPSPAARATRRRGRRPSPRSSAWRRRHQPGGSNAGSVFTNPPGDSAGRLIDAAGPEGVPDRHRRGLDQARQLHPGRRGRLGRRRRWPSSTTCGRWCAARHRGRASGTEVRLVGFDAAGGGAAP